MSAGGAAWELRATIAVLYTHQKAVKRPIFREGSLRIACGRAALLDATGRELDEETLTKSLLEQIRAGEELDFPGHFVRPEAAEQLPAPAEATPVPAPGSPCAPPGQQVGGQQPTEKSDAPSEKKVRQPFKRPRLLARSAEPPVPSCSPLSSSSAAPAPPRPQVAPARQQPLQELQQSEPVLKPHQQPVQELQQSLWEECVEEDHRLGCGEGSNSTLDCGGHEIWAQCVAEDAAHRSLHGADEPCRSPRNQVLAPMAQDFGNVAVGFSSELHSRVPAEARVPATPLAVQSVHTAVGVPGVVPVIHEPLQQPFCAQVPTRDPPPVACAAPQTLQEPSADGVQDVDNSISCHNYAAPTFTAPAQPQLPSIDVAQPLASSSSCLGPATPTYDQTVEDPIASTPPQSVASANCQAARPGNGVAEACSPSDSEDELLRMATLPGLTGHVGVHRDTSTSAITVPVDSEDEDLQAATLHQSGLAVPGEEEDDAGEADSDDAPVAALMSRTEDGMECEDPIKSDKNPGKADPKRQARKGLKKQREDEAGEGERQPNVKRRASAKDNPAPAQAPLPLRFMECTPPMGDPTPPSFPTREAYARHFIGALVCEMQGRLSEIAAAWRSFQSGTPPAFPHEVVAVAQNVYVGSSPGAPRTAALVFGQRTRVLNGDLRACGRGDLWILIAPGHEPLLMRSLWRGVSPRGRLLCTAGNDSAVAWLEAQAMSGSDRMVQMTALASSAFAAELSHADALQAYAEGSDCVYMDESGENAPRQHFDDNALDRLLGVSSAAQKAAPKPAVPAPDKPLPLDVAESPELAVLSSEQAFVVRTAAKWVLDSANDRCTMLVRGVFGSGKSRTLAACIVMLDRLLSARKDPRRILLVCQTNVAVDAVLLSLLKRQGWDNFARLGSFRGVDPALLYRTVSLMKTRQSAVAELNQALQRRPPEVQAALKSAIDRGILPPKAVVWRRQRLLATTTAALDAAEHFGPDALRCPIVLVDEATQLTEPAVFSCLRRVGAQQVLVVGDPRQLPPRVEHAALRYSLLERLWDHRPEAFRAELATQFRCHPMIAELGSALFYGGWLRSGVSADERSSVLGPGGPPLAVIISEGAEMRAGQSYKHDYEARFCAFWLRRALSCSKLQPQDLGVICLYRSQAEACARALTSVGLKGVQAATVDAFQGGEREVTILSCGRSTAAVAHDRFANCPRRLNVALSRARRHLVIVGGEAFLTAHPHLSRVMASAQTQGTLHLARNVLAA
mmetsp:Transcript_125752/g.367480  ORF Transcript_125752/g.367480 Transcript_125752/m.367480 type:complete len:1247 (-) Transcript_125752:200-3940(-)